MTEPSGTWTPPGQIEPQPLVLVDHRNRALIDPTTNATIGVAGPLSRGRIVSATVIADTRRL
jgi:hypothetical protein